MNIELELQPFPLTVYQLTAEGEEPNVALASLDFSPEEGWVLENLTNDLRFLPVDREQEFLTSQGQNVRLLRSTPLTGDSSRHLYVATWQFDQGLFRNQEWPDGPLLFTKWTLPCDELLRLLRESPVTTKWPDGVFTIEVKDETIHESLLSKWQAQLRLKKASTWRVRQYDESTINARSHFEVTYDVPQTLDVVLHHESQLRSFVNWVWMMWLHAPRISFWLDDVRTDLFRRNAAQVQHNLNALVPRKDHVLKRMEHWLNAWCSLEEGENRAINEVLRVYATKAMSIDLQYMITFQALVAFAKSQRHSTSDVSLGSFWARSGTMSSQQGTARFERLRWTRNEIVHVERNSEASDGEILFESERTKGLHEMSAVLRALVLARLGESEAEVNDYLKRAFTSLNEFTWNYF